MQFNALIVDPDLESRARLKAACHHEAHTGQRSFRSVFAVGKLSQALQSLHQEKRTDVMFLTHRFKKEAVTAFIEEAKTTTIGADCAYILVLNPREQNASTVATSMMTGTDGFLCEPFSVNSITEIVKIAEKVKLENAIKRLRAATSLILDNAMAEIDSRAQKIFDGDIHMPYPQKLKNAIQLFSSLDEHEKEAFREVMLETFSQAPPRPDIAYKGASKRVRGQLGSTPSDDEVERLKEENLQKMRAAAKAD